MNYLTCLCQHCSQKIEFPEEGTAQQVQCPNCGLTTVLNKSRSDWLKVKIIALVVALTHGKTLPKGEGVFRSLTHNRPYRA
jgi:DNA-directed RNA polymerase subunit RPC12/RpoP